jgi:hypothetical protein
LNKRVPEWFWMWCWRRNFHICCFGIRQVSHYWLKYCGPGELQLCKFRLMASFASFRCLSVENCVALYFRSLCMWVPKADNADCLHQFLSAFLSFLDQQTGVSQPASFSCLCNDTQQQEYMISVKITVS